MTVAGSSVDRYELLGEIATGGMATVYLGRQRGPFGFTRTVAIKSMHPHIAKDAGFRAMFLDEATLTARIRHPNVVPTLDIVASDTNVLLVMEYVEGVSLSTLVRRARTAGTPITPALASAIVCDLLNGLHAAHTLQDEMGQPLNVVHRDVSPQNVHVGVDGLTRVLDFGVAKAASRRHVTQGNEVKGKLAYMSSEQVCGEVVDHRTDVYAAGVVLWETLTGERLITGVHEGEMLRKVIEPNFRPPGISVEIDAIVMKALAPKKEDRWSSALEMAEILSLAAPPAPRQHVAALVKELAATELHSRAERLRRPTQSGSTDIPPEAKMIAEILTDHATETRATMASVSLAPAATGRKRRSTGLLIIAGGALVSAAIVGAFVVGTRTRQPPAPAVELPPPPVSVAATPSVVPSASIAEPAASVPPPPIASASVMPPKPIVPNKRWPKGKPDCRVPYTVDAHGDRHYRSECVE